MEKFNVNLDRPKVSSEEIKAKQNFDQVLKNYHVTPKSFFQKGWFWGTVGLATVAAVTVFTFTSIKSNGDKEAKEKPLTANNSSELPADTPCIKPPKEGDVQQYQIFKIDPKQENKLNTTSGSVITIPANSFSDDNGQLIVEEIEIHIREFYDKEDVFLSGIPMHYDSSGTKYALETAGMIEIRGIYQGNPILKSDQLIQIQLNTNNPDQDFNLYSLNEKENRWDYIQPLESEEITLEKLENPEFYKEKSKNLEKSVQKTQLELSKIENLKPIQPRKLDETKFSFDIDANKSQFPELAEFRNVIFEVGSENKGFSEEVYSKTWEDLRLQRLGDKYQVILTKGDHKEEYIVYPALKGKDYQNAKAEFDAKFKIYETKKHQKINELKSYEKEYELNKKKWEQAVAYSQKTELTHNQKNNKVLNVPNTSIHKVYEEGLRVFEVEEFGVYNCDRKVNYPSGEKIMASFIREDGSSIRNLHGVNLISNKKNSIFKYAKNELAQFRYNPSHENRIWMVDEKGEIYACGNDEFNKVDKKSGQHQFVMKKISKFNTVAEFKEMTRSIPISS